MEKITLNNLVLKGEIIMDNINLTENLDILNKIYSTREEELGKMTEILKDKLNNVTGEDVQNLIEKSLDNSKEKNKVLEDLDMLVENYEMKMSSFMENSYKQGFKDAFDLFLECTRK